MQGKERELTFRTMWWDWQKKTKQYYNEKKNQYYNVKEFHEMMKELCGKRTSNVTGFSKTKKGKVTIEKEDILER